MTCTNSNISHRYAASPEAALVQRIPASVEAGQPHKKTALFWERLQILVSKSL